MIETKATIVFAGVKGIELTPENILSDKAFSAMEELGVKKSYLLKLSKIYSPEEIYEYVDGCLNPKPLDYYFGQQDFLI